jgi:hypothetical protein
MSGRLSWMYLRAVPRRTWAVQKAVALALDLGGWAPGLLPGWTALPAVRA